MISVLALCIITFGGICVNHDICCAYVNSRLTDRDIVIVKENLEEINNRLSNIDNRLSNIESK